MIVPALKLLADSQDADHTALAGPFRRLKSYAADGYSCSVEFWYRGAQMADFRERKVASGVMIADLLQLMNTRSFALHFNAAGRRSAPRTESCRLEAHSLQASEEEDEDA